MVGGRLQWFASEWHQISNSNFVNTTIAQGYRIPFVQTPPPTTTPHPIISFSKDQTCHLDQAIQDLLKKNAIEEVSPTQANQVPGFYSSMFVIPKKNGGIRPVFNLRKLNEYMDPPHFKMETIREVAHLITYKDYLVSIDLTDAFLHIAIHPESRKCLRFCWKSKIYQWCTTPFGLCSIPFVFTKVCRPILDWARSKQIKLSAYLDDWLLIAPTKEIALQQTQLVLNKLRQLGWMINEAKSILVPTQRLERLGFVLDTTTMKAELPKKKVRDLKKSTLQVLRHPLKQTPRLIHSLTMRLQSSLFAILPARLYTRRLLYFKNLAVKSRSDWDTPQPLDKESIQGLTWWHTNLEKWNGRSFIPTCPQETIFVDASDTGWGCSWNKQTTHGYWTPTEASQSINWRELKAA